MMLVTSKACSVAFRLALITPYQRLGAAPRLTHQRLGVAPLRACASSPTPTEDAGLPPPSHAQQLEPGTIYFVSTPIGNLEDITLRAIRTLRQADVIAVEDAKVTAPLLRHLGVGRKEHPLVSHNEHNLARSVPELVGFAAQGLTVAVVSDAGTPGISDPGLQLAAECAARAVPIVPVPGACAATAAVSVSGFDCHEYVFAGFVSRGGAEKKKARRKLQELATEARAVVLYEAPHRLLTTLRELSAAGAGARGAMCARELTKRHEDLRRGSVDELLAWYEQQAERDGRVRGEISLVLAPLGAAARQARADAQRLSLDEQVDAALRARLAAGGTVSSTAKAVAAELGVPKKGVYERALELSRDAHAEV